jgi:hypothetical protein
MRDHLQEVIASATSSCRNSALVLGDGTEDAELRVEVFTDVHDRCNIATAIAVVRRGPNGDDRLLGEVVLLTFSFWEGHRKKRPYLIAFIDELVSTSDELKTVDMIKLGCNLVSKEPACTTGRNSPRLDILRIAPDQVAKSTLMRDLLGTSNDTDLIDGTDLRTQAAVNAENLTVNDSSKDEKIKYLAARLPDRRVSIFLLALLVKAINLGDLAGFMVASNECDLVGVPLIC